MHELKKRDQFALVLLLLHTVGHKKRHQTLIHIFANVDRFSCFFTYTEQEICNKAIIKYPTTPQAQSAVITIFFSPRF